MLVGWCLKQANQKAAGCLVTGDEISGYNTTMQMATALLLFPHNVGFMYDQRRVAIMPTLDQRLLFTWVSLAHGGGGGGGADFPVPEHHPGG